MHRSARFPYNQSFIIETDKLALNLLNKIDVFNVLSKFLKKKFASFLNSSKENILHIPNGINVENLNLNYNETTTERTKTKIGFFGLIPYYKDFMGTTSERGGFLISGIITVIIFMRCLFVFHLTETRVTERI